jgi:hypothetical protein
MYFISSKILYNSLAFEPAINKVEAYLPPIVSSWKGGLSYVKLTL